ncbi:unnamed protein product, partial [Brassica oleracea]
LCKSVVSPDFLTKFSPLRLYHTMPSQASTVLRKTGFVAFPISSSLELLCKSVDSPDLLTPSPLRFHQITPSQASTVLHNYATFTPELLHGDQSIPKLFTSYPMFAHTHSGLNESDDCLLRSSVTTCWARHGNVEFRVLDPIKPSALSSNLISPSASLEVKLELEIHLVYSVSHVGFKADRTCFSAKSSQIGLSSLNVVYGSGASHLKFLPINIPTSSYRCFNVVFDYQLFFRTIAMGTKVKLLFGFLHFAERDSPLDGSISSFSVLFSSFILPSSRAPGLSASVVNVAL